MFPSLLHIYVYKYLYLYLFIYLFTYLYFLNQAATGLDRTVLVSHVSRTTLKPKALIRSAMDIKGVRSRPLGTWVMCSPGQLMP